MTGQERRRAIALASLLAVTIAAVPPAVASAPLGLLGPNLIANPGAEAGPAASDGSTVSTVPGWSTAGAFTVVPYGAPDGFPGPTDPGPTNRGANFFVGGPESASSTARQIVGISSIAKLVDSGLIHFEIAGSFGGWLNQEDNARLVATFVAGGRTLGTVQLGPVGSADRDEQTGLLPRAAFGTVPAGSRQIVLTLTMTREPDPLNHYNDGYADELSLRLGSLFGSNLIVNPGAELGLADADWTQVVGDIPGWVVDGNASVGPYGADGFPAMDDPGPVDRGGNLFIGGPDNTASSLSQTIDVSAGARLIDSGFVRYHLAAYLGGWQAQRDDAVVHIRFESGSGVIGEVSIGPVTAADRGDVTGLLFRSTDGLLPAGTRGIVVTIELTRREDPPATYNDGSADELSLTIGL